MSAVGALAQDQTVSGNLTVTGTTTTSTLVASGGAISGGSSGLTINSGVTVLPSGYLGVGTSTPSTRFQAVGSTGQVSADLDSSAAVLQLRGNNGKDSYLYWVESHQGDRGVLGFATGSGDLVYRAGANSMSTGTEVFRIAASGSVGIGTASPNKSYFTNALTLNAASGNTGYELSLGDVRKIGLYTDGNVGVLNAFANIPLYFSTNNTTQMVISASGNVGIGTTNPAGKLDVAGSPSYFGAGGTDSAIDLRGFAGSYATIATNTGASSNYNGLVLANNVNNANSLPSWAIDIGGADNINYSNSDTFTVRRGAVEKFRVASSGNVGIGTTTPSGRLTVSSTSSDVLRLYGVGGGRAQIQMFSDTGANTGSIQGFPTDLFVNLGPSQNFSITPDGGPTAYLRVQNGNVGIGNGNPQSKLDVSGDAKVSGNLNITGTLSAGNWASSNMRVYNGAANQATAVDIQGGREWKLIADADGSGSPAVASGFRVRDASLGVDRMAIDIYGNVGFGTTSPQGKLNIQGGNAQIGAYTSDRGIPLAVRAETSGSRIAISRDASDVEALFLRVDGNAPAVVSNNDDLKLGFGNGAAWSGGIVIKNTTGNIGVGTTSPTGKLNIGYNTGIAPLSYTDGANEGLVINATRDDSSNYLGTIDFVAGRASDATNGGTQFRFITQPRSLGNPTVAMLIDKGGNVGIGTTTPNLYGAGNGTFLTIAGTGGTGAADGRLELANPKATLAAGDSVGDVIFTASNNAGSEKRVASIYSLIDGVGGANGFGGSLKFTTKTNNGTTWNSMVLDSAGNVGIGTASPATKLEIAGTEAGNGSLLRITNNTSGTGKSFDFVSDNGGSLNLYARTDGASRLYIQNATGSVGIGTTSPTAKLDVAGSVNVSGTITASNYASGSGATTFGGNLGVGMTPITGNGALQVAGTINSRQLTAPNDTTTNLLVANVGDDPTLHPLNFVIRGQASANGANRYVGMFAADSAATRPLVLQETGGNVGIGTTSPRDTLEVSGAGTGGAIFSAHTSANNIFAGGHAAVFYSRDVSGGLGISIGSSNTSLIQSFKTASLNGGNATTEDGLLLLNPSGGNVGIGTTNPQAKLDISGNVRILGPDGYNATGKQARLLFGDFSNDTDARAGILAEYDYGLKFGVSKNGGGGDFGANSLTAMAIKQESGFVGIGTTNPQAKLDVAGNTNVAGNLTVTGTITAPNFSAAGLTGATDQNVTLASNGAGTVVAQRNESATVAAGRTLQSFDFAYKNPTYSVSGITNGKSLASIKAVAGTAWTGWNTDEANTDLAFYVTRNSGGANPTTAEAMRITYQGNVGIGTSAPRGLLEVNGPYPQVILSNPLSGPGVQMRIFDGGVLRQTFGHLSTTHSLQFATGGTDASGNGMVTRMTIDEAGRVGIGTTTPERNFVLYDANAPVLKLSGSTGTDGDVGDILFYNRAGSSSMSAVHAGIRGWREGGNDNMGLGLMVANGVDSPTEAVRISHSGNVGIGTSTPAANVDIQRNPGGNVAVEGLRITNIYSGQTGVGDVRIYDYTDATGGAITFSATPTATGPGGVITSLAKQYPGGARGGASLEAVNGNFIFHTVDAANNYRQPVVFTNTGYVGLGTATPDSPLTLNTGQFMAGHIVSNSSSGTRVDVESLSSNVRYQLQAIGTAIAGRVGNFEIQNYNTGWVGLAITNGGGVTFSNNQAIITSSGNAGIGTLTPQAKLEVNGTAQIDGVFTALAGSTLNGQTNMQSAAIAGASSFGGAMTFTSAGNPAAGSMSWGTTATDPLALVAGTNRSLLLASGGALSAATGVTVATTGYVGVGTATPKTKLHVVQGVSGAQPYETTGGFTVESGGRAIIQMLTPANQDAYLMFGNPDAANRAFIGYQGSGMAAADQMMFKTSGSFSFTGGNVGIGTSAPATKLDVTGDGRFTTSLAVNTDGAPTGGLTVGSATSSNGGNLRLLSSNSRWGLENDNGTLKFFREDQTGANQQVTESMSADATVSFQGRVTTQGLTVASGDLNLSNLPLHNLAAPTGTGDATNKGYVDTSIYNAVPFTWNAAGHLIALKNSADNLGLGTTSPTYKLDVFSGTGARLDNLTQGQGLTLRRDASGGNQVWTVGVGTSSATNSFKIADVTANTDRLVISSLGRVGIGTTAPQAALDVASSNDANGGGAQMIVRAPQNGADQYILFRNYWHVNDRTAGFAAIGFNDNGSGDGKLWFATAAPSGNQANVPQKRMFIDGSGNVGIGTDKPQDGYKLSVEGKIRAREVVVNNDTWADYVFDPSYRNAPLSEVEQHIKAEKHLPGVPSAQEVAEHGVNVGQMQTVLLQKIEELTLHMIEQEKRATRQDARIQKLEEENAQLRTALQR